LRDGSTGFRDISSEVCALRILAVIIIIVIFIILQANKWQTSINANRLGALCTVASCVEYCVTHVCTTVHTLDFSGCQSRWPTGRACSTNLPRDKLTSKAVDCDEARCSNRNPTKNNNYKKKNPIKCQDNLIKLQKSFACIQLNTRHLNSASIIITRQKSHEIKKAKSTNSLKQQKQEFRGLIFEQNSETLSDFTV